jgi:hypothetical protein
MKAIGAGLHFAETDDYASFWRVLEKVLSVRHGARAVHSIDEIKMLQNRFSQNIRLFAAFYEGEMVAGVVVFASKTVAHSQYIASTALGRELGALDLVFSQLIDDVFLEKPWFSFGISTESQGNVLNIGLIEQKEGFGARACIQHFYEISL